MDKNLAKTDAEALMQVGACQISIPVDSNPFPVPQLPRDLFFFVYCCRHIIDFWLCEKRGKDSIQSFCISTQAGFLGTDKSKFTEVFTQRSFTHLRVMFQEYKRVSIDSWSLLLLLLFVVMMVIMIVMMMILEGVRMNFPLPDWSWLKMLMLEILSDF